MIEGLSKRARLERMNDNLCVRGPDQTAVNITRSI